jgi:hypothetical protein
MWLTITFVMRWAKIVGTSATRLITDVLRVVTQEAMKMRDGGALTGHSWLRNAQILPYTCRMNLLVAQDSSNG